MTIIKDFKHVLHGGDYNPDQWLHFPGVIDRDFELMDKASCNTFSVAIFSWGQIEVEENRFEYGWLDNIFERAAKQKIKLFLATPTGSKPAWLADKYPDSCRVGENGKRAPWGLRQNNCLSSLAFRERVRIINRKLAERYAAHPALGGWHISNEYGGECRCELCQKKYHEYLRRKYGTLENLNKIYWSAFWGHRITAWEQVNPWDGTFNCGTLDWRRFVTENTVDFFQWEIDAVREFSDAPVTTNMMGFYSGFDYWKFAPHCDFIADDCYPCWYTGKTEEEAAENAMRHDLHYTMLDKPFVMMESCPGIPQNKPYVKIRRPNEFQREMMLALGHGADGTMYFQWRKGLGNCEKLHGAVLGHDGTDQTLVFKRVEDYGAHLKNVAEIVDSKKHPETAVIYDWESSWAIELSSSVLGRNEVSQWGGGKTPCAHYRALWKKNIDLAVIDSVQDFSRYKLLVAPALFMLRKGVAERMKEFVKNGGTLVMTCLSAYVDENNACFFGGNPGGHELRELFGIWNEDIDGMEPEYEQSICWNGRQYKAFEYAEYLHAEGADVLGTYGGQFYAGTPAVTSHVYGKGKAIYIGARTGLDFLGDFYAQILKETGIEPVLENVPETLSVSRRDNYYFVLNITDAEQKFTLPYEMEDIWNKAGNVREITLPPSGSVILKKV